MRAAVSLSRNFTCGVVGEAMTVATPALSMSSSDFCGDQLDIGALARFALRTASIHVGGEMWWCTSMRCGLAWAAASRPDAANAPAASEAAPPATNARRLSEAGGQQAQRSNQVRRAE